MCSWRPPAGRERSGRWCPDDEYRYAAGLGIADEDIIVNGPGKSDSLLAELMGKPVTLILDSHDELDRAAGLLASGLVLRARLGLRVSPVLSFMSRRSRFGVDLDDEVQSAEVARLLRESGLPLTGLHLHHSGDRGTDSFVERLHVLGRAMRAIGLRRLDFVDCGGGLASGMPDGLRARLTYRADSLEDYGAALGAAMRRFFPDGDTELIVEPGTGLLADAGVYLTRVLSTGASAANRRRSSTERSSPSIRCAHLSRR